MTKCGQFTRQLSWRMFRRKKIEGDVMRTPLNRCLTTWHLVFLGIGQMAGAGMYVMTGVVAKTEAGAATFISYLIAGFVSYLSAMCYAEFAARVPLAGSCYSYAYVTVGEFIAFLLGWNILLEHIIGAASTARAWGGSFDSLVDHVISNWTAENVPEIQPSWMAQYPDFIAPLFLILLSIAVSLGAKVSLNLNGVIAVINVLMTALITILGFYFGKAENWTTGPFAPDGVKGIIVGASMCVYAYVGIDGIAVAGEEAKDPSKSIPIANTAALLIVTIMYVAMSTALIHVAPYWTLSMTAPFAEAFASVGYYWAKICVIVGTLIAISCATLGHCFSAPRTLYAMATDGLIFKPISYVNPKTQTPLVAIFLFVILAAILSAIFNLAELAAMSAIGTIITFFGVSACTIVLRYQPDRLEADLGSPLVAKGEETPLKIEVWRNTGKLKPRFTNFPILKNLEPGKAVAYATAILSLLMFLLSAVVLKGMEQLLSATWWAILLTIILSFGVVAAFTVILMHEQDQQIKTYKVPLLPFVPGLSMLLNTALLVSLHSATWIRLSCWMIAGFFIYFCYGIWNSGENEGTRRAATKTYSATEDIKSDSKEN